MRSFVTVANFPLSYRLSASVKEHKSQTRKNDLMDRRKWARNATCFFGTAVLPFRPGRYASVCRMDDGNRDFRPFRFAAEQRIENRGRMREIHSYEHPAPPNFVRSEIQAIGRFCHHSVTPTGLIDDGIASGNWNQNSTFHSCPNAIHWFRSRAEITSRPDSDRHNITIGDFVAEKESEWEQIIDSIIIGRIQLVQHWKL